MAGGFGSRFGAAPAAKAAPAGAPAGPGGFGSRFAPPPADVAPAPSKGGRGIFGGIGHFVASKADLAARDIKAMPGGLVQLGRDEYGALKVTVTHPFGKLTPKQQAALDKPTQDVKAMGKAAVTSVEHPLRDPFQTALTVTLTRLAGGLALRGAAAGEATRAGEGAVGAAKAAARKPVAGPEGPLGPRLLRSGQGATHLQESSNPAVRIVEHGYDKAVQKAVTAEEQAATSGAKVGRVQKVLAAHGQRRIGGSLDEQTRPQVRMRAVPAQALERSARKLGRSTARGNRRVSEAALELTSTNTAPEAAAAYHLAQAEKGIAPARNRVVSRLYQTVADAKMLKTNEHGDVIVNGETFPRLRAADLRLAKVQGRGDAILARYGIRTPEALQSAVNAPGRYRAGAAYEKPTPGKLGQSPALNEATKTVGRLQKKFDRIYEKGVARYQTVARPRTEGQARARLAELEGQHATALDQIAAARFGPVDRGEVLRRNAENARAARQASGLTRNGKKAGSAGRKSVTRPTVTAERRAQAEKIVQDAIAGNPDHPTMRRWAQRVAEIDQLRSALNPELGARLDRTALGRHEEIRFKGRKPELERVGGALSIAKEHAAQLERRVHGYTDDKGVFHPGLEKPTGVVGGGSARPGRGHVSYASGEKRAPTGTAAGSTGPVVGEAKAPIGSHANTGHNIGHGVVPKDVSGQAARHYRQILRFQNTSDRRAAAVRASGSDVRRSGRDVLVKVTGEEHATLSQAVEEALGRRTPTTDELAGLEAALHEFRTQMVPGLADGFAEDARVPVGTSATDAAEARGLPAPKGWKWVDRGALGELAKAPRGTPGRFVRKIDTVNSAVTAATVYFKVGHLATRTFTNAATNIIQGSARPIEVGRSLTLWKSLGEEDRLRALAASGQHGITALPHEGVNRVARVASAGAQWWARRIDAPFRFNSLAYEARHAGFRTPAQFRGLLDRIEDPEKFRMNAAERAKVDYVQRRANREAIAYDRLNDFEKRYITRPLWFYAWTAGATRFAINTLLEHPYKAAIAGAVGAQGRKTQQAELGDLPSYEGGLFKLAGGGNNPLVADFSTFSPYATPADVLEAGARPKQISGFANPVYGAVGTAVTGINQYGRPTNKPIGDALSQLVSPAPEMQIANAYLHKPRPTQMFRKTPGSAFARAFGGPGVPRRINLAAAHKAAARERSGR